MIRNQREIEVKALSEKTVENVKVDKKRRYVSVSI